MSSLLKFSLIENAVDSLQLGLEFAFDSDKNRRKLKLAVLLVTQAVELFLKERLRREHWSLVYKNVDKAGGEDSQTVSIDESKRRLSTIAKIEFDKEQDESIEEIIKIRNRLQHFEAEISFEKTISQLNIAIEFLMVFLSTQLEMDIRDKLPDEIYAKMVEIEELADGFEELASERLKKLEHQYQPIDLSERDASDFEIVQCPECFLLTYAFMPSKGLSECQNCSYKGEVIECARCGTKYPEGHSSIKSTGDFVLCENCWEDLSEG